RPFGQRQERRANDGSDRVLGARVKFADRFDGVIELLGDTVESVREFDARTQRSFAPVGCTTFLPLTEWSLPAPEQADLSAAAWETPSYFGPASEPGPSTLFELAESSLRPIVFLDEPQTLREAAAKHLAAATENYERHGHANSPTAAHYFW